jgi:hypothetical protein
LLDAAVTKNNEQDLLIASLDTNSSQIPSINASIVTLNNKVTAIETKNTT